MLEEHCPHRLTSLFFGRNEESGIRCVHHGRKFDYEGRCADLPSEPGDSQFRNKIRAVAYPSRLRGGLLWIYMGPAEYLPAFPEFEWLDLPASQRYAPRWHVQDTRYGFIAASERTVEDQRSYWRMNQYLLPFYTMITGVAEQARMTRMWVPMDDEHCWVIAANFRPNAPLGEAEMLAWKNGENTHRKVIPGTTRPYETRESDYLIDRQQQKTVSFTGIHGIRAQDAMASESGGAIVDRTREHPGSSDIAIIAMRKRLMADARALHERNVVPEVLSDGGLYRVRAHQAVVSRGIVPDPQQAWHDN